MFDTCQTCEEQETEVMFVNGLTLCYECARLTQDEMNGVPIEVILESDIEGLTLDEETL